MGRRSKTHTLGVWMNGEFVGHWTVNSRGDHEFEYDPAWVTSGYGRSISLSMSLQLHRRFKGQVVKNYFDNLLPDNEHIDGHAKNFSIFLEPKGGYRLTPRYDVLSAYPVLGNGPRTLQEKKIKMAMALLGKNRHYKWGELQRRHLESTAKACGLEESGRAIIEDLIAMTPTVIAKVASTLPSSFPDRVSRPILDGLKRSAHRLEAELPAP